MEQKLTMSTKERKRLKVLSEHERGKLTVVESAEILGISERQTYRIISRYKKTGDAGVIHLLRGSKSNRGYPEAIKEKVIEIYWEKYRDFGPTLFAEKLEEREEIKVNHETVRRWMRGSGIITNERKKRPHKKRRERRAAKGEMLQLDGSHHDWFEGRAPKCCLLNMVDDASGQVFLRFSEGETTQSVLEALTGYCKESGIPQSIYTDRYSVYYAEQSRTDYQKALEKLAIRAIYANSPQAKGRVERGNRTHQDRLVKEMRLRNISSIAEGNKFLKEYFIETYNSKFMLAEEMADIHGSVAGKDLASIFCYETERQVKNDYTFSYEGIEYQIERSDAIMPHVKDNVFVRKYLDESMHIFNKSEEELLVKRLKKTLKLKEKRSPVPQADHPWKRY
ncbi:MAG: ISNCY family transposase [Ignavibacteria bacterium]|nr:ISNCY family transposase [Ignavibacteria bacterium]MDP3831424.1 ISNCY family transposase [Ignavibacteriaceae bacterium]